MGDSRPHTVLLIRFWAPIALRLLGDVSGIDRLPFKAAMSALSSYVMSWWGPRSTHHSQPSLQPTIGQFVIRTITTFPRPVKHSRRQLGPVARLDDRGQPTISTHPPSKSHLHRPLSHDGFQPMRS
jgi:hypothetical protein